eukprot:scaffold42433_cov28-Attheya_sp.AAC.1
MAAPASGHWTFGIIVGYGLGLGVGLFMLITMYTGFRTVCITTAAATATPVPPTTVTTDVALAATATFEVAPATTAALEADISANSVVGGEGEEDGIGDAIVIDVVAQSTISSAAFTALSMYRNPMACATNSLYQRAKNEKESKSEQSMCCSTKHAICA